MIFQIFGESRFHEVEGGDQLGFRKNFRLNEQPLSRTMVDFHLLEQGKLRLVQMLHC
ncbi:hypothetical protein SXCC_01920 [Gluconacetobacter sp. SXCC-1]|nr:hypothetical protein SXCC_01920 [Gluconacetobacter sp. SXCC-1]